MNEMLDGYPTIELIDVVYNRIIENDTELAQLRAELERYKLALESLTPGGSEFSDSPERCVEFVRSREKLPARILRLEAENARLTAEVEACENLIHYCDIPDFALPELAAYQQARAARVQAAAPGTGEA